jgi:molybdopterin converting factor small subunit
MNTRISCKRELARNYEECFAMPIRVKFHGRIRVAARLDEIEVPKTTSNVGELLDELVRKLGPDFQRYLYIPGTKELSPNLLILINGHSVRLLAGLKTSILENIAVSIESVDLRETIGGG